MLLQTVPKIHPSLRPIVLGVVLFAVLNLIFTAGVTFSPLNRKFNFSYGNFLPAKLEMLKAHEPEKLDVLFLGTSQTNNGFVTSVFEQAAGRPVNSFNLGLPNNRYDVMLGTLQMHTRRFGKPRLVLVELSPSIQERDSYYYYLPALYYRSLIENNPAMAPDVLANPMLAWNVKRELLLSSFSSLHQYRYTFSPVNLLNKVSGKLKKFTGGMPVANAEAGLDFEGIHTAQEDAVELDPAMTGKGWYPKAQSPHMTTPEGVKRSVEEARKYYIDSQKDVNFDKLEALLSWCKQENIPVALVAWPNHPEFVRVFEASPLHQPYQDGLRQLLSRHAVPVINLNEVQSDPAGNDLFSDPRHLTPRGAERYSVILAQRLFAMPEISRLFEPAPLAARSRQERKALP